MNIYDLISELRRRNIYFELASYRDDYIGVYVSVPGEHWEIEFPRDGDVEIEVFRSEGGLQGEEALARLFEEFTD